MSDINSLMNSKAPFAKEDTEILNLETALAAGETTKVEKSPYYQDILRAYLRMRFETTFNVTKFHRHIVGKLDPEINLSNIRSWIDKLKKNEKKAWDLKVQMTAAAATDADATIETIRDTSIKVFYLKIQEFLQHPEMLDKMSFSQALQLYDKIERLHVATERLKIDKHDQGRKDAFTVFSMGLMAGKMKDEDVKNLLGDNENNEGQPDKITQGTDGEDSGVKAE